MIIKEPKDKGNFLSIDENPHRDKSSISYNEVDKSPNNAQNECQQKTQLDDKKFNSNPKGGKKQIYTIRKVPKGNKDPKINYKLPDKSDLLSKTNKKQKKWLNNKTKRNRKDNKSNQEIITQLKTNKIIFKSQISKITRKYGRNIFLPEGNRNPRPYSLMLQAFKKPYLSTVKLLEKFGNKKSKLIKVNLNEFFNNTENIKNALELSLEEIICKKAGNDGILNNIRPKDEKDKNKKIFEYFLKMKYKLILKNFLYNKEKKFNIDGEIITFPDFKTFDEVLEGKYNTKPKEEKNARVKNIETMTEIILDYFKHDWDAKGPRKKKDESNEIQEKEPISFDNKESQVDDSIVIEIERTKNNSDIFSNLLNSRNALTTNNNNVLENNNIYYIGQNKEMNKQDEGFISNVDKYYNKKNCLNIESRNSSIHGLYYDANSINSFNLEERDNNNSFLGGKNFLYNSGEEERLGKDEKFIPRSEDYQFNSEFDVIFEFPE